MIRVPSTTQVKWVDEKSARYNSGPTVNNSKKKQKVDFEDNPVEIPIWSIQEVGEDYQYTLPKNYIKFQEAYEIYEYELDEEDENFVAKNVPKGGTKNKQFVLTEDALERTLDFLEKESYIEKEYSKLVPTGEKNATACCVCLRKDRRLPDGKISNSDTGKCLGCGIVSHASCQGKKILLIGHVIDVRASK